MAEGAQGITTVCAEHHALTGWVCQSCHRSLCADCAGVTQDGVIACTFCGGACTTILMHRGFPHFRELVLDVLGYPVRDAQWIGLAGMAIVLSAMRLFPYLGDAVALIWLSMFVFEALDQSGEGKYDRPGIAAVPHFWTYLSSMGAAVSALALSLAPAAVYVSWRGSGRALIAPLFEVMSVTIDPVVIALLILPALWFPIALLFAATDHPLLLVVNPVRAWQVARRLGRLAFLPLLILASAALAFWLADDLFDFRLHRMYLNTHVKHPDEIARMFNTPLSEGLKLYAGLVAARVLGWLVFVRGDCLDVGRIDSYFVPVLGATQPVGALARPAAPAETAVPIDASVAAIDLPPDTLPPWVPRAGGVASAPGSSSPGPNTWGFALRQSHAVDHDLMSEEDFERAATASDVARNGASPERGTGSVGVAGEKSAESRTDTDLEIEPK